MASTEAPSKVKAALAYVDRIMSEIDPLIDDGTAVSEIIKSRLKEDNKIQKVQGIVDKIEQLDKALSYLRFVKSVEDIR